jgi:capsular exopolysaccharide synthesis family protein
MMFSRLRRRVHMKQTGLDLSDALVTDKKNPDRRASEAYRALRTHLLYVLRDATVKVIVVTGPAPGVGNSTTCANLGVVLAHAGKKTLLLDCDLRKPMLHTIFGLRNTYGVVDVLTGERSPQEVWQEPLPGLKVGTGGPTTPSPTELLGSAGFAGLLKQARQEFDYVLVDAPPVQAVPDPMILAAQGDGVLLVVDYESTRKGSVRRSMRTLEAAGANVLGTVMNNVETAKVGSYSDGNPNR